MNEEGGASMFKFAFFTGLIGGLVYFARRRWGRRT
jgi:hypothetical protein